LSQQTIPDHHEYGVANLRPGYLSRWQSSLPIPGGSVLAGFPGRDAYRFSGSGRAWLLAPGPAVGECGLSVVMWSADFMCGWSCGLGLLGIFTWFPQVLHPAFTWDWSAAVSLVPVAA
jgi:hypothetical protein